MDEFVGQQLGNFYLHQRLGEGGMGAVYSATDMQLQRTVAVKIMHPHIAENDQFRNRFIQEARSAAALDHPNIVRIFTFEVSPQGFHYLVMEYLQLGSLRGYIDTLAQQGRQVEIMEALTLIQHVASALDFAHQQGVVHRDIKPDNVLLKQSTALGFGTSQYVGILTDFGLAKLVSGENMVKTQLNNPMGTLPYMSPEQFKGGVDARSDLYSLGVMMYEVVVGRAPFIPRSANEAMQMHLFTNPPQPTMYRPDLPPSLEPVLYQVLAKDPDHRFQTGGQLIQAINMAMGGGTAVGTGSIPTNMGPMSTPPPGTLPMPHQMPAAIPGQPQLLIEREGYASRTIPLTKSLITIGRDPQRDLPIAGDKVSRMHAQIERETDGTFTITDLSSNGTFMNGQRLVRDKPTQVVGPMTVGPYRLTIIV